MKNNRILISGASIAGPALAFWLVKYGFNVTIIEQAPSLRTGGYKIDIRGKAVDITKHMGLHDQIKKCDVDMQTAAFLDSQGNVISEMAADVLGMKEDGDMELLRSDLSRILFEATHDHCEYIFNESIQSITQTDNNVIVQFTSGKSREFDLLIGADGIHSKVRSLIFGNESTFSLGLGKYYYAIFSTENNMQLEKRELFFSSENKLLNIYGINQTEKAIVLFVFRCPDFDFDYKNNQSQKQLLLKLYGNESWVIPSLLEEMQHASDFYFDEIKQIHMPDWYKGRIALAGDSAYSPSLASGQGTSLALAGAYVLAGELKRSGGEISAFAEYARRLRPFVKANQQLGQRNIKFMIPAKPDWINTIFNKIISTLHLDKYHQQHVINTLRKHTRYAANCIQLEQY